MAATSYNHSGGTGDRSGSITVTTDLGHYGDPSILVDGNQANSGYYHTGGLVEEKYIRFDFGYPRVIDEATFYESAGGYTQGVYKWQVSNNGSYWTDIGSSFTLGLAGTNVLAELAGNTSAWRYYQLRGVSGSATSIPWLFEIEFKIDDAPAPGTRIADTAGSFDILGNVLSLGQWQNDPQMAGFALQFSDSQPTESLPLGASSVGFVQARQLASWQWAHGTDDPNSVASMMSLDGANKLGLFDPAGSGTTPSLVLNPYSTGNSQFPGNLVAAGTASRLPNQTLNGNDGSIILTRSLADSLYAATGSGGGGSMDLSGYYTKTAADALLFDKADKSQLSGLVTTSSFNAYQAGVTSALGAKADASTVVTASGLSTQLGGYYTKTAADARFFIADTDRYAIGAGALATQESSQALGVAAQATGVRSLAMGYGAHATGTGASAVGYGSTASAEGSQSFGQGNSATGSFATAIGFNNIAGSYASVAVGYYNEIQPEVGSGALAMGFGSKATNYSAMAIGSHCEAGGFGSVALGFKTKTNAYYQVALGVYNSPRSYSVNFDWQSTDPVLQIGNGVDDEHRSNAFEVLKNGDLILYGGLLDNASETPRGQLRGVKTVALGENLLANTFRNVAFGRYNIGGAATTDSASTWLDSDPLFELGNGDVTIRRNALTVRKNGETTLQHKDYDAGDLAKANVKALEVNGSSAFNGKVLAAGNIVGSGQINQLPNQTLNDGDGSIILTRSLADSLYATGGSGGTTNLSNYYTKTAADALLLDKADKSQLASLVSTSSLTTQLGGFYTKTAADALLLDKADKSQLTSLVATSSFNTYQTSVTSALATKADAATAVTTSGLATQLGDFYTKTAADALLLDKADKSQIEGLVTTSSFNTYKATTDTSLAAKADAATAVTDSELASELEGFYSKSAADARFLRSDAAFGAGEGLLTNSFHVVALGRYNVGAVDGSATEWVDTDPLFELGIGTGDTDRRNALTVRKNGEMTLQHKDFDAGDLTKTGVRALEINGSSSLNGNTLVAGRFIGNSTVNQLPNQTLNGGDGAIILTRSLADSLYAAAGSGTITGQGLLYNSFDAAVFGRYNVGGGDSGSTTWVESDPLFELGNGTAPTERSNAVTVKKSGETILQHKDYDSNDLAKDNVQALTVNGSATVNGKASFNGPVTLAGSTTIQGVLIISQPAGGISMGQFGDPPSN